MTKVRPQPQLYRHRPDSEDNPTIGDCFRTCVAMLVGMPADGVPHFVKIAIEGDDEPERAVQLCRDWLAERGLMLAQFIFDGSATLDQIMKMTATMSPGVPFMVLGQSPRGDWGHVVVVQDGRVADPALGTWRDDDPSEILTGPTESVDGEKWWWVECIVPILAWPDPVPPNE